MSPRREPETTRWFLVMRGGEGELRSVLAFDEAQTSEAVAALELAERRGVDCVLLGADRLGTAIKTHGSWFDEPCDPLFVDLLREDSDA